MTTITIGNIPVKFPFEPYDIQKNYMTKVIECLDTPQNGILESPTGTGKTLSLLCASLAWLENRKKDFEAQQFQELDKFFDNVDDSFEDESKPQVTVPKIIYSSRTHTQLHQAMQEMKRTAYNHMKACVLGSREQMCIDNEVISERNAGLKVNICRTKVKKNQCLYYNKVEKETKNENLCTKNIVDIEDVVTLGRTHDFCPYYMARELKAEADVIFMPYNYLLDPKMNKTMGDIFYNNIIIFDEAHNIEKVCEDAVSVQIKTTDIQSAIDDINAVLDLLAKGIDLGEINFNGDKLTKLNGMLIEFKKQLNETTVIQLAPEGTVFEGDHIFTMLENSKVVDKNHLGVTDLINNIVDFLATNKFIQRSGYGLQIFGNLLFVVFYKTGPEFRQKIKECFKVQIDDDQNEGFSNWRSSQFTQTQKERCRVLNFWCFCPGFGMNMLMDQNVRCVILTSGTLAPLKPLISELELDVGVCIENPHIVKGDQVCVKILSNGPDMQVLNSNYQNRNNPKYMRSLGLAISNLIRIIPDGVLIFFPSYVIMEKTIERWKDSGTWDNINRAKPIYIEPKDKTAFNTAMLDYYAKIKDPSYKGAIFIGVCRGKISEGLDFADINGRAVFITGLPYPPLRDPKIILKKQYLDFRHSKDKEYLKGDDWYSLEATRAINQAIGRVIRHKDDYGAIILLDSRFVNYKVKSNLSLWLRQHITDIKNFGEIVRSVRTFFQNAQEKLPCEVTNVVIEELLNVSTSSLVKIHARKGEPLQSPSKKIP